MAKLTRVSQKVFGQTAGISQLGVFGSFAAGSPAYTTDPAVVQSLSNFSDGWFAAVVGQNSPAIQDMNSLCFLYAYQLAYILQQGVPEWDAGTTYYIGSIAQDGAGNSYTSLQNNNLNHALTNTSFWAIKGGAIRTVTTTATVTSTDDLVRGDSTAGVFTITLPAVASVAVGKIYTFKFVAGTNAITIKGNGSQLIDLVNTYVLYAIDDSISVENNGTTWDIISSYTPSVTTTGSTVAAGGVAISASCGSFSTASTSPVLVTNMTVSIVTTGRPVQIMVIPDGTVTGGLYSILQASTASSPQFYYFYRNGSVIHQTGFKSTTNTASAFIPPGALSTVDVVAAGTHTYQLYAANDGSDITVIQRCKLLVREI